MQLNIKQIKEITLGALQIFERGGYICFSRFMKLQEEDLTAYGCGAKVFSGTNIMLEFYTHGGKLNFEYEITPGTIREYYSVDLKVNGVYCYGESGNTNSTTGVFSYDIPTSQTEQRVTVYFPSTARLRLQNLCLPDDYTPPRRSLKILALGDSLVQGYGPDRFSNSFMNVVADALNAHIVNQAIGGDCFREENVYFIEGFDPDYITVAYGINDWASHRLGRGEKAVGYLKAITALYPTKRIFLTLPCDNKFSEAVMSNADIINAASGRTGDDAYTLEDVRRIIAGVAADFPNIICINAKDFVPSDLKYYFRDKVHLNDLGNLRYAEGYIKEITKYIDI